MANARRGGRERAKSDSIDAVAVARAALREGLNELPAAQLEGPELDLRLLVDHRERLVRQRVALNNTLQWHLHDLCEAAVLAHWGRRTCLGRASRVPPAQALTAAIACGSRRVGATAPTAPSRALRQ
jgi:transposase